MPVQPDQQDDPVPPDAIDGEPVANTPSRTGWHVRRSVLVKVAGAVFVAVAAVLAATNDGLGVADRLGLTAATGDTATDAPATPTDAPATPTASATPTPGTPLRPGYWPVRAGVDAATGTTAPALDSTIDDPAFGDQRNFVQIRVRPDDPSTDDSGWGYSVDAEPNDEIEVAVFVANSASADLGRAGAVRGLTARLETVVRGGSTQIGVTLSAHNAEHVWSAAVVELGSPASLTFVEGTASYWNGDAGLQVTDDLGDGEAVPIGANALDGTLPVRDSDAEVDPGTGWLMFRMYAVEP